MFEKNLFFIFLQFIIALYNIKTVRGLMSFDLQHCVFLPRTVEIKENNIPTFIHIVFLWRQYAILLLLFLFFFPSCLLLSLPPSSQQPDIASFGFSIVRPSLATAAAVFRSSYMAEGGKVFWPIEGKNEIRLACLLCSVRSSVLMLRL